MARLQPGHKQHEADGAEKGQPIQPAWPMSTYAYVFGSYVAPDWTADWLHREAVFILDRWSNAEFKTEFEKLDNEQQAQFIARLTKLLRTNNFHSSSFNFQSVSHITGLSRI